MARASFTLRKAGSDAGTHVQYPPTYDGSASATYPIRSVDDSFLRGDNLQTAPAINSVIPGGNQFYSVGTFTADAVDYTQVYLTWSLPITDSPGPSPEVTEVLLVYSDQGEPDVIGDGSVILQTSTVSEMFHSVAGSGWAYYTLFLKYESNTGDLYYEPGAKLAVLVPTDYGSRAQLFNKMPLHYRLEDGQFDEGVGGPLERFLGLFGWDIDRFRTLIDYLMICKDPQEARGQELDLIAQDLGVDMISEELGTSRLRAFLNDIGDIRRSNGTASALETALTALTGSVVTVNTTTNTIYVRPQRVNFIKDPTISSGLSSTLDGGTATIDSNVAVDGGLWDSDGAAVQTEYPSSLGGSASTSYANNTSGYWNAFVDISDNTYSYLQTTTADIVILPDSTYYFSVHTDAQSLITEVSFDDVSVSPRVQEVIATTDDDMVEVGNRYYWRLYVPTDYAGASVVALSVKYETQSGIGAETLFDKILLEENNIGQYFDGNTAIGGWLVDPNGSTFSDYQWAWYDPLYSSEPQPNPLEAASFSIYTSNYVKTKHVVSRLLPQLLPVNELVTSGTIYSNKPITVNNYTIKWNYLPGYEDPVIT